MAPDGAAVKAAQSVARPAKWRGLGCTDRLAWGECQGSGKDPYQVRVDHVDLAFKCSCPSRKLPCKHTLGLLLLFADGKSVPSGTPPAFVDEWSANRAKRAECIDQSGSMAASVVYSAIFGAVLATLPAVSTSLVVFDTAIVDLTEELDDPIDLLFSTRRGGGGTDINRAVAYCQQLVRAPHETIFVLISDLFEGGVETEFMKRAATLAASGVQFVTLLALSDEGAPHFNADLAAQLAAIGIPAFACTPDRFPELMAAAIQRVDLRDFAAK